MFLFSPLNCPEEVLMQTKPVRRLWVLSKTAKQTPDLPHFSLSHPLPPHSKAGISCWWPSANAHSLTENLLWRWAWETEEGENYKIEMHVMTVPSGKIWKVYTAGTLFYLLMPERQTITKITHKHQCKTHNVTEGNRSCWLVYKKGLVFQSTGQKGKIGLHFTVLERITQNSELESESVLAWIVSLTEAVEEESLVKDQFLVLLAEDRLQGGPMWCGSSEDKGCIEARGKGIDDTGVWIYSPKTQPTQVSSTKLPFYYGTPSPLPHLAHRCTSLLSFSPYCACLAIHICSQDVLLCHGIMLHVTVDHH